MIIEESKLNFWDVVLKPKRSSLSSRADVNLVREFRPKYGTKFKGIPIIAANMATGTFDMLDIFAKYNMFVAIAKFESDKWNAFLNTPMMKTYLEYGFYTIGITERELTELVNFHDRLCDDCKASLKICIDIANGYSQSFASYISKVRNRFPNNVIVAGNVVTPDMTQELILNGADYVKIGIGSGSKCSTRLKTATGYPQLSAIIECADVAHGLSAGIISDGGIRSPGDFSRAFCGNADMVMAGGIFAGTTECHGEVITKYVKSPFYTKHEHIYKEIFEEKKFKVFYGMSSEYAQKKHMGGMKEYRTSEGLVDELPYVGSVEPIIKDILGGIRSTGTYIGANDIKHFGKCGTFVKTSKIHDMF